MMGKPFRYVVPLAAMAVACCRAQTQGSNVTSCIESLDTVFASEQNVEDDSELRTYVLCPNVTFSIATAFNESGGPVDGQYPLRIARSNIHVLCGEDGSSANNCILEGGMEQLAFEDLFGTNESSTNVLIQGLTFAKASTNNVAIRNEGNVSLVDCIFKDNNNENLIVVSEEDVELDMTLEVLECIFSDNQVWSYSGSTIEGLVAVYSGTVSISDSIFTRNALAETETTKLEYAVGLYQGALQVSNTCFLDNDDRLAPIARDAGELKVNSNSVHRNSTNLPQTACDFISDGDMGRYGFNASNFSCQSADSPVCTASALKNIEPSCYKSFADIDYAEDFLETDEPVRTYRLCPDSVYLIRSFDSEDDDRENTTPPLIVGHSNLNILCGASGSSSNNCTLQGGTYQLTIHDEYRVEAAFENVLVQGLTFQGATTYNVLTSSNNDVELKDCIFTENRNKASILVDLSKTEFERVVWSRRATQEVNTTFEKPHLVLTVAESLFFENVVGVAHGGNAGVITNHKGSVRILRSTFYGTKSVEETLPNNKTEGDAAVTAITEANDDPTQFVSYVIGNIEGNMELIDNCFVDNHATIAPVLSYKGTISGSRNGGTESQAVANDETCEFVAEVLFPDAPESSGQGSTPLSSDIEYACIEFDVKDGCAAPITATTTDMPRGVSPHGTLVGAKDPTASASSTSQRYSNVALYCIISLIGAVFLVMVVTAAYNLHRGASPLRLPTFRSDPIPPIL